MLRRYRSSYPKRRAKAQYFPSSARSFRYPSYYQRIGRTIQTTPGRIPRSPMKILSQPELERMYRTLVQYKYPFPQPPPVVPIQPFMVIDHVPIVNLFSSDTNYTFDPVQFKSIMDTYIQQNYPLLWEMYSNWVYQLNYLSVMNTSPSSVVSYQFQIQLNHGLFETNPYGFIIKSVNNMITGNNISPTLTIQPNNQLQLRAARISALNTGVWQQTTNSLATNDPNPSDQGLYPIMDSSSQPGDLYYSVMEYVQEENYVSPDLSFILHVVCFPSN